MYKLLFLCGTTFSILQYSSQTPTITYDTVEYNGATQSGMPVVTPKATAQTNTSCENECTSDPTCLAFQFDGDADPMCNLLMGFWSGEGTVGTALANGVQGVKLDGYNTTDKPYAYSNTFMPTQASMKNETASSTLDACKADCSSSSLCLTLVFVTSTSKCTLYTGAVVGKTTASSDETYLMKTVTGGDVEPKVYLRQNGNNQYPTDGIGKPQANVAHKLSCVAGCATAGKDTCKSCAVKANDNGNDYICQYFTGKAQNFAPATGWDVVTRKDVEASKMIK